MRKLFAFLHTLSTGENTFAKRVSCPLEVWLLTADTGWVVFGSTDTV